MNKHHIIFTTQYTNFLAFLDTCITIQRGRDSETYSDRIRDTANEGWYGKKEYRDTERMQLKRKRDINLYIKPRARTHAKEDRGRKERWDRGWR